MEVINFIKVTGKLIKQAGKTIMNSRSPVPPTKIHPLMPIVPRTIGEMVFFI